MRRVRPPSIIVNAPKYKPRKPSPTIPPKKQVCCLIS